MNPNHDWQPPLLQVPRPDIEVEALLTGQICLRNECVEGRNKRRLGHSRAIGERLAHALPWLGWLRWLKPMAAERGGGVGIPLKAATPWPMFPWTTPCRVLTIASMTSLLCEGGIGGAPRTGRRSAGCGEGLAGALRAWRGAGCSTCRRSCARPSHRHPLIPPVVSSRGPPDRAKGPSARSAVRSVPHAAGGCGTAVK